MERKHAREVDSEGGYRDNRRELHFRPFVCSIFPAAAARYADRKSHGVVAGADTDDITRRMTRERGLRAT